MYLSAKRAGGAVATALILLVALLSAGYASISHASAGERVRFEKSAGTWEVLIDGEPADPTPSTPPAPAPPVPSGLVTGLDATEPAASWTKPALGETSADPAYGLDVTRLTSADGTRFDRNTYSRRQAENADGTRFFTYHGDATYRVYRTADGALVADLPVHPDGEPQWHPTDPDLIRHTAGSNSYVGDLRLYETDVTTGETEAIADLTERLGQRLPGALYLTDGAEGSPSEDGNRYAWRVENNQEDPIGMVTYDLATDTILGVATTLPDGSGRQDAISISPSGRHVVVQAEGGTFVYPADLSSSTKIYPSAEHSDIAKGADGHDYYVYIDFSPGENGGWALAHDLDDGSVTRLFDLYDQANTSIHFSGKAYDNPGWVVASTYNCKVPGAWSCEKVMAVNLHSGEMVNLAHTYNCGNNYWTETHAVTNRSLSRVYFNSDGGSCGIDAEVYRIDVPSLG